MKLFLRFLIFGPLLLLLIVGGLMQTSYVQEQLKNILEKKSGGTVTIGKLKGLLPLWLQLESVHYKGELGEVMSDHMTLFLSPITLFSGELSLVNVHISHMDIMFSPTSGKATQTIDFPFTIHDFRIDTLVLNQIELHALRGNISYHDLLTLCMNARYRDFSLRLRAEEMSDHQLSCMGRIQKEKDATIWLSGQYNNNTGTFIGEVCGEIASWRGRGNVHYTEEQLLLSDLSMRGVPLPEDPLEGSLSFVWETHALKGEGSWRNQPFSLEGILNWQEGYFAFAPITVCYLDSTITGTLAYDNRAEEVSDARGWQGTLSFCSENLSPLIPYFQGKAKGELILQPNKKTGNFEFTQLAAYGCSCAKAAVDLSWEAGEVHYTGHIEALSATGPYYEAAPTTRCWIEGLFAEDTLQFTSKIEDAGNTRVILNGSLPILLGKGAFPVALDPDRPYQFHIEGGAPLSLLLAPWDNTSIIAQGIAHMNLSVTGGASSPLVYGEIFCDHGYLESVASGAVFQELSLHVIGEGKRVRVATFTAQDHETGTLSASGEAFWDPTQGGAIALTLQANDFRLFVLDPFTTAVNATLTLKGPLSHLTLSGEATIVKGELSIPDKLPPHIPFIEVTYINPIPTYRSEITFPKRSIPMDLDLTIQAPKHFLTEGRGLTAEWEGALHIAGSLEQPTYSGKLRLIQGRFVLVGHTFDLTEGKIRIEGLNPKEIQVNLKGDLELATLTASFIVNGSLDNLRVVFASNPPMSTNQILSWILFNQDINELTPFQACRLANTLVSLSGKYGGPKVFDTIREGLGLDVFDITHCDFDASDFTFQVGKYLSQGTFVGVNKSLSGNFDSIEIQMRLYRNFFLEANYGGSLNSLTPSGGKFIFKWYKSY